ncbi:hypothetical protein AUP68_09043 [Ilyonectria robusta]
MASLTSAPSPYLNPEQLGMLPLPESPLPSNSALPRHRHTASMSSGPHPASPLAQTHLMQNPDNSRRRAT